MKLSMVAPELRNATRLMSIPMPIGSDWGRRLVRALVRLAPGSKLGGVTIEALEGNGAPLRIYRPDVRRSAGALLWIHGGGFMIGTPAQDDKSCAATALELGIVVVGAGYRLAPEHPFPAPLDDCYAAWTWMQKEADALGIDPRRIAIGGQSAGGGLAASLVQRVQDSDEIKPAAQWLFCPMLDDRTAARRELDAIGHKIWDNRNNAIGWRCFLGREPGAAELPPYAAAARRADLHGLPPAWIGVGSIELFHAEDEEYARRLRASGVDTTFVAVPGAPHGFEAWAGHTTLARDLMTAARDWLRRTLDAARASPAAGG